jgi:hypothetical protein
MRDRNRLCAALGLQGEQQNDTYGVRRLQDELRSTAVERRTLTDMVAALEDRFQ